jgi:hypothetical protein
VTARLKRFESTEGPFEEADTSPAPLQTPRRQHQTVLSSGDSTAPAGNSVTATLHVSMKENFPRKSVSFPGVTCSLGPCRSRSWPVTGCHAVCHGTEFSSTQIAGQTFGHFTQACPACFHRDTRRRQSSRESSRELPRLPGWIGVVHSFRPPLPSHSSTFLFLFDVTKP